MAKSPTPAAGKDESRVMQRTLIGDGETLNTLFQFPCPACGQRIRLSVAFIGQPFLCLYCQHVVTAPRSLPSLPAEKVFSKRLSRRSRRGPWRRLKRFFRSWLKPFLIGLAAAAVMGIGLGIVARWLWD
jgi:hypothetical protein